MLLWEQGLQSLTDSIRTVFGLLKKGWGVCSQDRPGQWEVVLKQGWGTLSPLSCHVTIVLSGV